MIKRWTAMALVLLSAALAACGSSSNGGSGGSGSCGATAQTCPATPPSYKTDVAPIISKYCTSCHAAGGEESDIPLDTYSGVSGRLDDITRDVQSCDMPPTDETSTLPTDTERDTILAWIACGGSDN